MTKKLSLAQVKNGAGVIVTVLVLWFFGHPIVHFLTEILAKTDTLLPGSK